MGINDRIYQIVHSIREGFGVSKTVWGVKKLGEEIAWEFYFYDYRRRERNRSITRLLEITNPFVHCGIPVNENLQYFMFSIDINNDFISAACEIKEIHMYIGNPGSNVSSGICYSLTGHGTRLENFYFFFDAEKEMKAIMSKTVCSTFFDDIQINIDQILWPELKNCEVIVVANKQENDAIYFSRINIDQLIFFLKRMRYPADIIQFTEEYQSKLDYLLFDVGFDYRMDGNSVVILKSGYYGTF
jgi:hypothetical protein